MKYWTLMTILTIIALGVGIGAGVGADSVKASENNDDHRLLFYDGTYPSEQDNVELLTATNDTSQAVFAIGYYDDTDDTHVAYTSKERISTEYVDTNEYAEIVNSIDQEKDEYHLGDHGNYSTLTVEYTDREHTGEITLQMDGTHDHTVTITASDGTWISDLLERHTDAMHTLTTTLTIAGPIILTIGFMLFFGASKYKEKHHTGQHLIGVGMLLTIVGFAFTELVELLLYIMD